MDPRIGNLPDLDSTTQESHVSGSTRWLLRAGALAGPIMVLNRPETVKPIRRRNPRRHRRIRTSYPTFASTVICIEPR